ncbi:SDR family NAD(P)-dependent oxidoreductase [Methylobacterium persicinum]|uniref:NAD(P)-dependent dehydrogenase (Short-subunit alcohol dehydrogenase family) n=1 Tax=Methylobacterium persicinum TaxID=374426 RepID=A0ABU0HJ53_9HYPH|nr:SDR family NAD(P)-dependent oxidoreductase [Methylobacterium persicinum]MDQ0442335.1 NAD(P)-dependent dehydrogenase (short-subunit alcohol dehydrogenase family) [Methylobacterium persicinum]GJE37206.1 putative oxidoreductase [Methylobacterium persicinum]
MLIADRVILVTGAASGLGRGVAELLSEKGAKLVLADLAPRGADVADLLGATFVRTDVADDAEGRRAVEAAVSTHGGLHGLVNCAGIVSGGRVVGRDGPHDLDAFARTVRVNLIGTFNMIRLAAQAMAAGEPDGEGERGVIVSTASIAAFDGQIGQAAYAASKGGVASLTLPLARELAQHGIRVVAIAPGVFETPMMAGLPDTVREALGRSVPFPARLGRPAEFAALVAHVIGNPMLNGEVIRLDGALRMAPR